MAIHRDLAEAELHEPKGASLLTGGASDVGKVYMSDGAGSGSWGFIGATKQKLINSLSDFPTPVSGVITLVSGTLYVLGDSIDVGTNRFVVPTACGIIGIDNTVITLTSSGAVDLFTMTNASARIAMMTVSAPNARVFNYTSTGLNIFRSESLVITSCNKIGLFNSSAGGILRFSEFSPISATTTGIEITGSFNTLLYESSVAVVSAGALLDIGTATFDTFILRASTINLASGTYLIDGATGSANINAGGRGLVLYNQLDGAGASAPLNGITPEDSLWNFHHNSDIEDTRPDGLLSMTGNATPTTISVAGTYALVAGTWTIQRTSQSTGTAAGRITYTGGRNAVMPIAASCTVEPASGTNKTIQVALAINGTVVAASRARANTDAGIPISVTAIWQHEFASAEYVEVFVTNATDTVSVLVSDAVLRMN